MSLGKLLATGRSLVGGAPEEGRYNLSSRNRLPKFGSERNPFAQPASAAQAAPVAAQTAPIVQSAPVQVASAATSEVVPAKAPAPAPAAVVSATGEECKKTRRIPELADQKPGREIQRVTTSAQSLFHKLTAHCLAAFVKLLGFVGRLPGRFRRPEQKSVFPRMGKAAVQTELSLENVKVVRNDLEESDLEIVTADTATSTQVAPTVAPAVPNRGPLPPALKKLTNRILGPKTS